MAGRADSGRGFDRRGSGTDTGRRSEAVEALRVAVSAPEPDLGRLSAAVPAILAEVLQRRRAALMPGARIVSTARFLLPRLAAATALLLVVALVWPHGSSRQSAGTGLEPITSSDTSASSSTGSTPDPSLDAWIVTGSAPSKVSDPVLDALVR